MKKFERLIDERAVKIAAHIVFDMPRSIDQQPPLPEQKKGAHEADAQDKTDVFADDHHRQRAGFDAFADIVDRVADQIRNIKPEQHPEKNKQDAAQDIPFVRLKITRKFLYFFHK